MAGRNVAVAAALAAAAAATAPPAVPEPLPRDFPDRITTLARAGDLLTAAAGVAAYGSLPRGAHGPRAGPLVWVMDYITREAVLARVRQLAPGSRVVELTRPMSEVLGGEGRPAGPNRYVVARGDIYEMAFNRGRPTLALGPALGRELTKMLRKRGLADPLPAGRVQKGRGHVSKSRNRRRRQGGA